MKIGHQGRRPRQRWCRRTTSRCRGWGRATEPRERCGHRHSRRLAFPLAPHDQRILAIVRIVVGSHATTDKAEADKLINDAKVLEKAGCFAIVLEKIPATLGAIVTDTLKIPTIGIGAGRDVDGQVLVLHDMLGITTEFSPRFLRRYHNLNEEIKGAILA